MKSIRPAILIAVEFVYLSVYVTLAFVAAKGNSPTDSCPLFIAPLLTWFLLIIGLIVSADVGSYRNRVYFLLAMSVHYFVTFLPF